MANLHCRGGHAAHAATDQAAAAGDKPGGQMWADECRADECGTDLVLVRDII